MARSASRNPSTKTAATQKNGEANAAIMLNGRNTTSAITVLAVVDGWKRFPHFVQVAGKAALEVQTRSAFTPCSL